MQFNYEDEDDNAVYAMHVKRGLVSPLPAPPQFFHSSGSRSAFSANPSYVSTVSYANPVPLRPTPPAQIAQMPSPMSYAMPEEVASVCVASFVQIKLVKNFRVDLCSSQRMTTMAFTEVSVHGNIPISWLACRFQTK